MVASVDARRRVESELNLLDHAPIGRQVQRVYTRSPSDYALVWLGTLRG